MEFKHLHSSDDKLKWFGYGEWIEEPDFVTFDHCGIKCKIVRVLKFEDSGHAFGGYFCGYCKVSDTSPSKIPSADFPELEEQPHGGITYQCQEDDGYWIGFDCAHSGDLVPSLDYLSKTMPYFIELKKEREELKLKCSDKLEWMFEDHYRNLNYVIPETMKLAEQISKYNSSMAIE